MKFTFWPRLKAVCGVVPYYGAMALVVALAPAWLWAEAPAWWAERGVLKPAATADDYAAVNQGQVKNIAKQAYNEMEEKLPGGAGSVLDGLWAAPPASTDDYRAVNIGQLKNVAKPFYDRLIAESVVSDYPWGASTDDYAVANVGQVKHLFSFVMPSFPANPNDTDSDDLLDSWEITHFGDLSSIATADPDGDGLNNLAEFLAGSNPNATATAVSAGILELNVYSP